MEEGEVKEKVEEMVEETVEGPEEESEEEPEPEEESEEESKPEPEEGECECYSVDPPGRPWRSTFAFGTYQCTLCGRRRKK